MLPNQITPVDFHRTPELWDEPQLPSPEITFHFELSGKEIFDWVIHFRRPLHFPVTSAQGQDIFPVMEQLKDENFINIRLGRSQNPGFLAGYPSHGLFEYQQGTPQICALLTPQNGTLDFRQEFSGGDNFANLLWDAWNKDMFYFTAERLAIGESGHGHAARLSPNASNLPNILHILLNERGDVFRRLVDHLTEIFPTVGNLSIRSRPENSNFEIRVWPTTAMQRVELSFPLNSSGTGVAQAIAILVAIMTVDNAVIIIDEISSFLHPAAAKALLRILRTEYPQHQYIISTHAPEVISFSNAKTIHLVKRKGYESKVERLNLDKVGEFRDVAQHLGVSMADVFAADRVIWVEGPTEELCFPYLYQVFSGQPVPRGTIITSVAATGDFNRKRNREIVYEVYNRLSSAAATLVVATMFSFDTEELSDAEKANMVRDAGGRLRFLPRRHLECYLLDPEAIANIIIAKDSVSANVVTSAIVAAKLTDLADNQKYGIAEWAGNIDDQNWQAKVDAAKLIGQAVSDISEGRATFRKKEDSLELIQGIVSRDREKLRPLFEYVDGLITAVLVN